MGGCCSAPKTANRTVPAPKTPPGRGKAAKTLHPAEAKTPAKANGHKVPPAMAATEKAVPAALAVNAAHTERNALQSDQHAGTSQLAASLATTPAEQSTSAPENTPEVLHPPEHEGKSAASPDNSLVPASTAIVSPSLEEFEAPPTSEPAAQRVSPANFTPERAQPPVLTPQGKSDTEDRTRGPSTAQVEEVPPTPARESDVATGKALPADDARVLLRVPPPPPTLSPSSAQGTPRGATEHGDETKEVEGDQAPEALNPLVDILRLQQEGGKQRYPTALTTDAKEEAPLEVSIGDDKNSKAAVGGPKVVTGAAKYMTLDTEDAVEAGEIIKKPLAERGAVIAFTAPTADSADNNDAPKRGLVFKILFSEEWEALRKTGEFHGNAADQIDGSIKFATLDQAIEGVTAHQTDNTPRVLICCTIGALSNPAGPACTTNASGSGHSGSASPLRWESDSLIGQRIPRLHRTLYRGADVLWYKECTNGKEIAEQLHREVMMSGFGSEGDVSARDDTDEEPEMMASKGDEDDLGNRPITFTDTSEIERGVVDKVGADEAKEEDETTLLMTPPAEPNNNSSIDMPIKSHTAIAAADEGEHSVAEDVVESTEWSEKERQHRDEDDKPQPIVKVALPHSALEPPAGELLETRLPVQHAASTMQVPETGSVTPREGRNGNVSSFAPPRRVPPPLPSPPAEPLIGAGSEPTREDEAAIPPPSRPAPPPILTPPPG
ncbi:hypothetical protein ABL78_4768 [Leptomonas seymouri]|uniref:Uncharacterized protein n=1 Tax=Leptomonas seymouri TaxID=5684 RepID=A0A0N0P589_LEPSE|nr:hypothetical protein ABL78_4768 [Leptomonas seymouri]|eukprot:KPI86179.1 hypothetical protein ABL78_4768 [Leptomonas seymouri]